jgi:hypothetical protein
MAEPLEDQLFDDQEKLFRRVMPSHFVDGRASLAGIKSTVSYPEKSPDLARHVKSPSSVREKYGTAEDARQPHCAEGRQDVSSYGVFSVRVGELPKAVNTESRKIFDFYPFHHPTDTCPGHTLIHCCELGNSSPHYDDPTQDAKNKLRATLFQKQFVELAPLELAN